jgi:hypothetical protein
MNLQKMLKQAQELQGRITEMQAKLENESSEGSSGGGAVKAVVTGKGYAVKIDIDTKLIDPAEKEMLEDLVVAAFNDAKTKMEARLSSEMNKLTSGLALPPGFKLPV